MGKVEVHTISVDETKHGRFVRATHVVEYRRRRYMPHNGAREMERRRRQMAKVKT